ncbi:hypothetical protein ARGLB_038_00060 [Arthrobacter globiformis NBRC 12137]|uniref:Calpastatin n=1 Tax=Arthrobacter globiformis (strain ATCC 8010 / DSM 20124 / JCM 1332 / NBRC 12137 / NCIMB 8907 / NRRL B-2979 / 168) TaxID=1077972 RepID=H0QKP8_ARTG1|nr:DUF1810 domain-containing protein [Arthrobacter globiformis]GAB13399.1 hypothetical protein ARGLB_038_00060 [Arthrobacter globiformis NBRC 12137]
MNDPHNLERFVAAQNDGATYAQALEELRAGSKRGHWMWFVFPQIAGLGQSATSRRYAIASLEEARAYLQHPVLGPRLIECAAAVHNVGNRGAAEIFGGIDARKLQSSMTLFLRAAPEEQVFRRVLEHYFGGEADAATDRLLASPGM